MIIRPVVLAILASTASGRALAQDGAVRACLVVAVRDRMAIDGLLSEETWAAAPAMTDFNILGGRGEAVTRTVARVAYDRINLYVAVECQEPAPQDLVANCRNRDDQVWFDDCVEVFVSPSRTGKPYFQFVVNSIGTRFDSGGVNHGWNGEWTAAAEVGKSSWTVEYAIPWRTLSTARPRPGDTWRINVCRERQAGPPGSDKTAELSCWSTCLKQFHEPEHYGYALFVGKDLQAPSVPVLQRIAEEQQGARVRVSVTAGELEFIPPLGRVRQTIRAAQEKLERQRQLIERTVTEKFAAPFLQSLREIRECLDALEAGLAGRKSLSAPECGVLCQRVDEIARNLDRFLWKARFAELLEGDVP